MPRPNLLFIFTDEQRADTLAAYGNRKIQMPNLNRLARQSVVFERAYCTQPVCTPSRSSLMTGLYPHTTGCTGNNIPLPRALPCLPEMIESGRYATGYHGKWHLGDEIFAQHGFEEWVGIEDGYRHWYSRGRDRDARSAYHHFLKANGFTPTPSNVFPRDFACRIPEPFGKPAFLAREASRFIRQHRRHPFILYVNFLEPHMPFFSPRNDQYDPRDVTLPRNFNRPPTPSQHLKARLMKEGYYEHGHSGYPLRTEAEWRRMIANYWGLNSLVDTHVGAILKTLDDCGLTDNTIVVFTSDHGDMMGSHRLIAKCVMFEEAIRVPLLIKLPGQRRQRRMRHAVSQIDLVPTLLDLMGQPIPSRLQGVSRKAELEGARGRGAQDVFVEWSGTETGILERYEDERMPERLARLATRAQFRKAVRDPMRTIVTPDGWKFTWSRMGQHELYNLRADPWEMKNLAARKDMKPRLRELTSRIRAWQVRMRDKMEMTNDE